MADLKKLYSPKEAAVLYNSNKIRFNPTAYTLKENLIFRSISDLMSETISSYDYSTELRLFDLIQDHEYVESNLKEKIDTPARKSNIAPTEADCAAIKEYNLSIAIDYLVKAGNISATDLKGSDLMNAIIRTCVALDSVESCSKEMYWLNTNLWQQSYVDLHNFVPLKRAFEYCPLQLPMSFVHNGIDVIQNDISATPPSCNARTVLDESYRAAVLYKAYYYVIEFLWAYRRLRDSDLQRALAWWIEHTGGDTLFKALFTVYNSAIIIHPDIEQIVMHDDPADRFQAYQAYMNIKDGDVITWAENLSPESMYVPMNPVLAMFISYAENIAVTHVRVNSLAILYTYCNDKGYIDLSEEDALRTDFEGLGGVGAMLGAAVDPIGSKSLMDLNSNKVAGDVDNEENVNSKYNGNNGIFEALDTLDASFDSDKYKFSVKDVRVTDASVKSAYEKICSKVSLVNRELIRKIKDIKVYNTGGKNPGVASGRLDRKAMYRYQYDPNIFYNNTYKQLENDLAFGIILDMSGSMSGDGIENGKITMIVLHETLKALGINHSIIGHTSRNDYSCEIERYQSFREDKTYTVCKNYALVGIKAHACNCDSGALYYMEKAMDRVQNKDKIVLIFSDGYPTSCTGTDLINQVQAMEKKGIKVIGIGIDFPSISKYYTDYANGRNLKDMLEIVTTILQEYILKKKVD